MENMFLTLDDVKKHGYYPEDFDESLAPRRYRRLKHELELSGDFDDRRAIVVHGMRRMGKTYALIKLGEVAEEYGYKFLYADLSGDEKEFSPKNSGRLGKKLADEVRAGEKLLIGIDEAFNIPIASRKRFLGPFRPIYKTHRFLIILTGSYAYDILRLRTEIERVFIDQSELRTVELTMPRIGRLIHVSDYVRDIRRRLLKELIISANYDVERTQYAYILLKSLLKELGIIRDNLRITYRTNELYEEASTKSGVPSIILGKEDLDNLSKAFVALLNQSFRPYLNAAIKVDLYIESRPKIQDIRHLMKTRIEKENVSIDVSKLPELLALSTGLILPRRKINLNDIQDITDLIEKIKEPISNSPQKASPIPSCQFARFVLLEMGIDSKHEGTYLESLVAHALISNYFNFFEGNGFIRELPIFATNKIDFLYVPKYSSIRYPYIIEVKKSLSNTEDIADAIINSSRLGYALILVTDRMDYIPLPRIRVYSRSGEAPPIKGRVKTVVNKGSHVDVIISTKSGRYTINYPYKEGRNLERVFKELRGKDAEIIPPIIIPINAFLAIFGYVGSFS